MRLREGFTLERLASAVAGAYETDLEQMLRSDGPEREARQVLMYLACQRSRGRTPLTLAFSAELADKSEALRMERLIKRLPKATKERLVGGEHAIFDSILRDLRRQHPPEPEESDDE